MGNLISGIENSATSVSTIVLWPSAIMNDVKNKETVKALIGTAVGGGAAYYVFGSPVPIVQKFADAPAQEFIDLAFMYGTVGVGYWASTSIYQNYVEKQ